MSPDTLCSGAGSCWGTLSPLVPSPTPFLLPLGVSGVWLSLGIDVTLTLRAVCLDVTMWPWVLLTCGKPSPELSHTPW